MTSGMTSALRAAFLMLMGAVLLAALTASRAAADIYVSPPSVEAWTEILAPYDGEVFVVASPSDTVSVTALGYTTISYLARATLDLFPYTGEASGGTLYHYYNFVFDGVAITGTVAFDVADAPAGEVQGEWAAYDLTMGFDVFSITRNVGVGYHDVFFEHTVFDQRSEIHIATSDYIVFEVVAVPESSTLALLGLGIAGLVVLRRGRRVRPSA